jgi:hypothetical protein
MIKCDSKKIIDAIVGHCNFHSEQNNLTASLCESIHIGLRSISDIMLFCHMKNWVSDDFVLMLGEIWRSHSRNTYF